MDDLAVHGGTPVRSKFLTFGRPLIGREEEAEILETLRSGWIGFGPKARRFEQDFATYSHSKHALSLNSCTAGLHLALVVAGVRPGDEVITTALTFVSTANAIIHAGAAPVFVDVNPISQNMDPEALREAVTSRTKAIIPVHMCGWPCDLNAITEIAAANGIPVVEDAAHAAETWYRGKKVGAISPFTVFSFYATKNLTTGEGGMITTDNDDHADRLQRLRLHGLSRDAWNRYSTERFAPYEAVEPGYKYNMTDLQASLGIHQLRRLERNLTVRERHWQSYDLAFHGVSGVTTPGWHGEPGDRHARHLYTLQIDPAGAGGGRMKLIEALHAEGIGTGIHFVPVPSQPYYRQRYGYRPGMFPNAERIGARTISLPLSALLSPDDVADVIEGVLKVLNSFAHSTTKSGARV